MKKLLSAVVLAGLASSVSASSIVNGDFSSGLSGWNAAGDVGVSGDVARVTAWGELSQNLSWSAGEKLSFDWDFQATDYLPYNDWASFSVLDSIGNVISSQVVSNVAAVGSYGNSGWQTFNFTFASSGVGSIKFGSYNMYDNALSPNFYVDNVKSASTPEPTSLLMMGLGLLGLGFARKRAAK